MEELLKRGEDLEIVWLTADEAAAQQFAAGVRAVPYTTRNRIRELCTAKVWLDNNRKGARVKKPEQWYLQTWHGFALKRIERDAENTLPAGYAEYAARDSAQTDLIVSNSALMTKIYKESFGIAARWRSLVLPGMMCCLQPPGGVQEKVRQALHLPSGCRMAPVCAHIPG